MISHSKPFINSEIINSVKNQLVNRSLAEGHVKKIFCEELQSYIGADSIFLTSSGTSALYFILKILGVKEGDEIILPTYVCHSVAEAILLTGAKPVFSDIGNNWVLEDSNVEKLITNKTKAIVLVHIFGIFADVKSFKKFRIPIIEDCCQSFAKEIKGNDIGIDSDFAFYSFHATKCITTGEGGAIACFNKDLISKVNLIKDQYRSIFPISDLQAIIGLKQLRSYFLLLEKREQIAKYYFQKLPSELTKSLKNVSSMFFRFPLRWNGDFEKIKQQFEIYGISVRKGVDELLHSRYNIKSELNYNTATELFYSTISIPIYPSLKRYEIEKIVKITKQIYEN